MKNIGFVINFNLENKSVMFLRVINTVIKIVWLYGLF